MQNAMRTVRFTRVFAAAHRVWNDPGKCNAIHGHNYRATVEIESDAITDQNFVVPFDVIKNVIDHFDHTTIIDYHDPDAGDLLKLVGDGRSMSRLRRVMGIPSTEFMAELLATMIRDTMSEKGTQTSVLVTLRETDGIEAEGFAGYTSRTRVVYDQEAAA